jgi:hypothetical protein
MAATRTTEQDVKNILDTALTTAQITAFIEDANLWVTEELGDEGLSDSRLEMIERWLACALIRAREVAMKDTTVGDVTETYQRDGQVTEYLKHASALDPTGSVQMQFLDGGGRYSVTALFGTRFVDDTTDQLGSTT